MVLVPVWKPVYFDILNLILVSGAVFENVLIIMLIYRFGIWFCFLVQYLRCYDYDIWNLVMVSGTWGMMNATVPSTCLPYFRMLMVDRPPSQKL